MENKIKSFKVVKISLSDIIEKFDTLKGTKFVGLRNYTNSKNEISNQIINVGVDILKAKKKDLETLKSIEIDTVYEIADKHGIDHKTADKAISELINSGMKNVSNEIQNRTEQSKAQTETYIHINSGLKIHKESYDIFLNGFSIMKEVVKPGEYKKVNSQDKTIIKKAIQKHLDLRMIKYRQFKFDNMANLNVSKNNIIFV